MTAALAWRNLWRRPRRTILGAAGIAFASAFLIFMPSLQAGVYGTMIDNTLRLYDGYAEIERPGYRDSPDIRETIEDVGGLLAALHRIEGLEAIGARAAAYVLLSAGSRSFGAEVVGVQPDAEARISTLPSRMQAGRYLDAAGSGPDGAGSRADGAISDAGDAGGTSSDAGDAGGTSSGAGAASSDAGGASSDADGAGGAGGADRADRADRAGEIVLGETLARNLRVGVGDAVTVLGVGRDGSLAADSLTLVGTFATGVADFDRLTAEMPLGRFQETFSMPGEAHTVVLGGRSLGAVIARLPQVEAVAAKRHLEVLGWRGLDPGLWQAIVLDASTAGLIYVAMVVVVAFSLLNSLLMAVLERTNEFGMLMALGMRPGAIARMVWLETALLLALGLAVGLALGVLATAYYAAHGIVFGQAEQLFGQFGLPGAMYPRATVLTVLAGPGVIALATLLAGLLPFWRVYRLEPVPAMRAA